MLGVPSATGDRRAGPAVHSSEGVHMRARRLSGAGAGGASASFGAGGAGSTGSVPGSLAVEPVRSRRQAVTDEPWRPTCSGSGAADGATTRCRGRPAPGCSRAIRRGTRRALLLAARAILRALRVPAHQRKRWRRWRQNAVLEDGDPPRLHLGSPQALAQNPGVSINLLTCRKLSGGRGDPCKHGCCRTPREEGGTMPNDHRRHAPWTRGRGRATGRSMSTTGSGIPGAFLSRTPRTFTRISCNPPNSV